MKSPSVAVLVMTLAIAGCAGAPAVTPPTPSRILPAATNSAAAAAATPTAARATPTAALTPSLLAPASALAAQLQGPLGLAFDQLGNLYVSECEWTYAAIDRIDSAGVLTRFAGTGKPGFSGDGAAATSAELKCPTGLAIASDGTLYFSDHLNNRVRHVDAAGTITTFAGSGPAGMDMGSFSGDGGPAAQATLQEPWGLAFDSAGRLYVADRDNVRVRRVKSDGVIATVAGFGRYGSDGDGGSAIEAKMCPPVGVAIGPDGRLVLPDACTSAIRIVDTKGTITTFAKTDSSDSPSDTGSEGNAVFGSDGSMFVQAGPRIFKIDVGGTVTPVAGNGTVGVPTDGGRAIDAPLPLGIWGLALDKTGNLYVADGATSVWKIDAEGVITRFAGRLE